MLEEAITGTCHLELPSRRIAHTLSHQLERLPRGSHGKLLTIFEPHSGCHGQVSLNSSTQMAHTSQRGWLGYSSLFSSWTVSSILLVSSISDYYQCDLFMFKRNLDTSTYKSCVSRRIIQLVSRRCLCQLVDTSTTNSNCNCKLVCEAINLTKEMNIHVRRVVVDIRGKP